MKKLRKELKPGQIVVLDEKFNNSSTVEVVRQTKGKLFTTVKSESGYEWDVMTYRLTDLDETKMS